VTFVPLEASAAWLKALLEGASDAIVTMDETGEIVSFNPAAEALFGYPATQCIGHDVTVLMGEADASQHPGYLERYMKTGEARILGRKREVLGRHSDASELPLQLCVSEFEAGGRRFFTGILHDLSAARETEAALRHSQRMESVGRLAASIAHDLNNLLTVVLVTTDDIDGQLPRRDPLRKDMEDILGAGRRAQQLTHQLLSLGRRHELAPRDLQLAPVLKDMAAILRRTVPENVVLEMKLPAELPEVHVDPLQLEQILLNLVVNASDALETSGTIEVSAELLEIAKGEVSRLPKARYVCIQVADDGPGMDADTLAKAFNPFFSTKGEQGTGLGLATVRMIARQLGGAASLESESGLGTRVRVYLPTLDRSLPDDVREPARGWHGEKILLVDDDDGVRQVARRVLSDAGYHVSDVPNPLQALALFESHPAAADLVATDLTMPEMNGRELAARLREVRPELPVLFFSGYGAAGQGEAEPHMLGKPFTRSELLEAVATALGRASR